MNAVRQALRATLPAQEKNLLATLTQQGFFGGFEKDGEGFLPEDWHEVPSTPASVPGPSLF